MKIRARARTLRRTPGETLREAVAAVRLDSLEGRVLLSASDVVINEIMYNSAAAQTTDEYVELYNKGTTAVDLTGWRLAKGVDFTFGNRSLGAGEYVVVAADLNTFAQKYPSVSNVVGSWTGHLSNNADTLELDDNLGQQIDKVDYASDGEWAQRRPGVLDHNHRGWAWVSGANGLGKSLELINPALSNNKGQNWGASIPDNGTPGAANSIASTNIAPLIGDLSNFPIVPKSNQQVTITASVTDEQTSGLSVTVFYRDDGAASFQGTPMFDDGLHGDGIANDGVFGGRLPARPNNTVVEFYVRASDATGHARTWPGPTDTNGTQGANALYQVDDTGYTGAQPLFKLIMRESERAELAQIGAPGSADRESNAAMNGTFISMDGTGSDIRYQIGIRNRGGGSRDILPNNYRINFGNFNAWHNGEVDLSLNGVYSADEVIGSALAARAGVPAQWATPVQVRVNNVNHASSTQGMFGSYSYVEVEDQTFVTSHFPTDDNGNYYRGVDGVNHNARLQYSTDITSYETLYPKENNKEANDYTDLINLTKALDATQTPDASFGAAVNGKIDVKEWMRYFAFNVLVGNGETALGTGSGDDYGLYRGATDTRFQLVAHDLDTILGFGDTVVAQNRSIFVATNSASIKRLLQFPDFAPIYFQTLKEMAETVFTQAELSRVIHHAGDGYIDSATLDARVADGVARAQSALAQIPQTLTVTGTPTKVDGYAQVTSAAQLTSMVLSGGANALVTKSIRVNGKVATYTPYQGAWTITNTSNTLGLQGGLNRVLVQELDAASKEVGRTFVDVWYSLPTGTTVAAGAVSGVWSPANGPYRVAGNITVASGQSLTIQPGTSVYFANNARLTVNGLLTAVGTDTQRIRFTHDPVANTTAATWGGVYFANTTLTNRLSYSDIEFAGVGGPDTQISAAKADLDHDTWSSPGAGQRIIDIVGASSFSITNSVVGSLVDQEPIHFLGSIFAGGQALIQGNVVGTTTGHNDIIDFTGPNRPGPIFQILDNVFTGTGTGGAVADDILDVDGTDAHIEGNVFMNVQPSGINDTNSAISGGLDGSNHSEIVSTRNFFYNVDHAFLMKEGNSVASINDTIVNVGTAVFNFNEPGFAASAGLSGYADGDIFYDIPTDASGNAAIVQNPPTGGFTLRHSITPSVNPLAGLGNLNLDPALLNTASVLDPRIDFAMRAISPAIGTGPNGVNMGAAIPSGGTISGEPAGTTGATGATLTVGGPAIYAYQWRLDNGAWSGIVNVSNPETTNAVIPPIVLSGLANGPHTVSVVVQNDAGVWQSQSTPTISKSWTVNTALGAHVRINEVLADNQTVFANGGTHPDVIELYNDGNATADLADWGISDNPDNPRKYVFPAGTTLGAGQYMLLYGDSVKGAPGHVGFSLSADGEGVYLSNSRAAGGTLVDSVTFGTQLTDLSIGRLSDGVTWGLTQPTLGSANVKAFVGDASKLKLNEWQAEGVAPFSADFIELYNPDPLPVELTAMSITDRAVGWPTRNPFVPLSFIRGSGFLKLTADGDTSAGANHLNFKLDHDRGEIALFDADQSLVDFVFYGPQSTGVSEGLSPDGSAKYSLFNQPSPGLSNPAAQTQQVTVNLSPVDAAWKYNQTTIPAAPAWTTLGFVDTGSEWQPGAGLIYHETATLPWPKNTELADATHPYNASKIAYYFRRTFSVTNPASFTSLKLRFLIDDGAVFYLNGHEIYRANMPTGTITSTTQALANVSDATTISQAIDIPVSMLVAGNNILAVEVHQNFNGATTSSDVVFGMTLDGVQEIAAAPGAPLRVTEVMYNPPGNADVNGDENEFIELQNTGTSALNLTGYKFSAGIDFTFGNLTLAPGQKTVVVKNLAAFQSRYGTSIPVAGEYRDALDNNGELIRLEDNLGVLVQEFTYSSAWFPSTSGNGDSLVINDPAAAVDTWSSASSWHASTAALGTPGIGESTSLPQHAVVVNEVLTHSTGTGDWIELKNTTGASINIGGWYLSDEASDLFKYRVPDGTIIPGNGLLVMDEATSFGAASQGASAFSLDSAGDDLYVSSASGVGVLGAYRDAAHFGAADLNVTMGRYTTSTGRSDFVALSQDTKGAENAYPLVGPIVISEIQYHPSGSASEFIELHNSGTIAIDLGGWQLGNGVTFTFAAGTAIQPGGWLLVVPSDPVQFRQTYSLPASVGIVGPYEGTLANDGDVVELSRPAVLDAGQTGPAPQLLVDRVSYGTSAPWPTSPDGTGPSLARRGQSLYGDDAADWIADSGTATGSPGAGTSDAPPTVAGSLFYVEGRSIRFVFSKDVSAQLHAGDLVLHNDTTGQTIDSSSLILTYDAASQTATWTSATPWVDGNYTATLTAGDIQDGGGRALDGNGDGAAGDDYVLTFFSFGGDANRDRVVDFNDLVKLAQNYNTTGGKDWANGDFTGDGNVDFNDLVKLAQNYNRSFAGAAAAMGAVSFQEALASAFAASQPVTSPPAGGQDSPSQPPVTLPPVTKPLQTRPGPVQTPTGEVKRKPVVTPVPAPKPKVAVKPKTNMVQMSKALPVHAPSQRQPVRVAVAPAVAAVAPTTIFGQRPIKRNDRSVLFA